MKISGVISDIYEPGLARVFQGRWLSGRCQPYCRSGRPCHPWPAGSTGGGLSMASTLAARCVTDRDQVSLGFFELTHHVHQRRGRHRTATVEYSGNGSAKSAYRPMPTPKIDPSTCWRNYGGSAVCLEDLRSAITHPCRWQVFGSLTTRVVAAPCAVHHNPQPTRRRHPVSSVSCVKRDHTSPLGTWSALRQRACGPSRILAIVKSEVSAWRQGLIAIAWFKVAAV
jgi:hypothetical protein